MAAVSLRKVSKSYGAARVIRDVDLDIPDHAFAVLVGPSGCGKSTLLKLIAGLDELTTGEVSIGGRVVNDLSPADRDIAMVFQSYALYPHMTVADNLGFHLKIVRMAKAERETRIGRVAENLGLAQLLHRFPRELSGGQRQRVAMGRAIVREPQVFLFDEPLSNLDAKLRIQVRAEIKALQQRLQTTTIYVTHDQVEAMTLADFIVVMRDGAIEQVGAPLEVYDRPINAFVGGFIGSPPMNLVEGILRSDAAGGFVAADGARLPLDRPMPGLEGRKVIYGIRPGSFATGDGDGTIQATVAVIEPTGDELFAHVMTGEVRLHVAFTGRPVLKVGDPVALKPLAGRIHLFDAVSGQRIPDGAASAASD
jgi:multiple sugar transport system ATP-binding protein